MVEILLRLAEGFGHTAIWIIVLLVILYGVVLVVFVWCIRKVLQALLAERDPQLKEILRQTLRDLLELLRFGKRR